MPEGLILCVNQSDNETAYKFNVTGINVYSFEEALYHVYNHWKESVDEFLTADFSAWIKDSLGLNYLLAQIAEIRNIDSTGERLLKFLSLTGYYDEAALAAIFAEISLWEQQLEWERLKDMADLLMKKNEPAKAYSYYQKALSYGENINVLNNLGVCLMKLEMYNDATDYFKKAYNMNKDDFDILVNFAEALIYKGDYERAFKYLRKAEKDGEAAIVSYLYGKLCLESKNLGEAISHYTKAISLDTDPFYKYALTDAYVRARRFNQALDTLGQIQVKDKEFYINQSEVFAAFDDYSAAVKCMEQAIIFADRTDSMLWATLAKYHRLNYDLPKAEAAAVKAGNLDKENKFAKLEIARIKKAQGKTRDYQNGLSTILDSMKKEYRGIFESGL